MNRRPLADSFALMRCRKVPLSDLKVTESPQEFLSSGGRPSFHEELQWPDALRNLIEKCWSGDPDRRPEFRSILPEIEVIDDTFPVEKEQLDTTSVEAAFGWNKVSAEVWVAVLIMLFSLTQFLFIGFNFMGRLLRSSHPRPIRYAVNL